MLSLLNYFYPKNPDKESRCKLSFTLQRDDKVYIESEWDDTEPETAHKLAKLCFLVHSGHFSVQLIKMLEEQGVNNVKDAPFITELLLTWQSYQDLVDNPQVSDLVVKPTDFIKHVNKP
jgi:hypothetical protein